jgi:hypothetical protein
MARWRWSFEEDDDHAASWPRSHRPRHPTGASAMTCSQHKSTACGCGAFVFPQAIFNPPNLAAIDYRVGDYVAFRNQLLRPLPGETELLAWQPSADGDLAVQMMEWWAYIADILTFYNERIANEAYLRTAQLPESVNHLVQLLGYRPRPALGARGMLAALLSSGTRLPLQVPAGLQIQSKPGPGQAPQVFEADKTTAAGMPDVVVADVAPSHLPLLGGDGATLWLAGKVTGIKPADRLLLINAQALNSQSIADFAWIRVKRVVPMSDPLGNAVTQLTFSTISGAIATAAPAADYVLLRSAQSSPLWTFSTTTAVISSGHVDLAGIARGIEAGGLLLIDVAKPAASSGRAIDVVLESPTDVTSPAITVSQPDVRPVQGLQLIMTPQAVIVTSYQEKVWYANGDGASKPTDKTTPAIAIPHAIIHFAAALTDVLPTATHVTVRWAWSPVGQLAPVLAATDYVYSSGGSALVVDPASKAEFPPTSGTVFMEDPAGSAAQTTLTVVAGPPASATPGTLNPAPAAGFASPIDIFFNLFPVSRGKKVPGETLGSGNPMVAGQDFVLSKSPVTYFNDPASISGDNFSSTVEISVNGVRWKEVRSFYGQPPDAQIYLLREDDQAKTHAVFGDGVNGARLPTGVGNIVASYRFGAGGTAPAAETLTSVLTPTPGLKGVRNPLAPTGGAEADSPARLRTLAPKSVLTFNRAVSIDDYATIAMTGGGVTQAAASFAFDPLSQRPLVTLWVAGDDGAVASAAKALAGAGATMRNVRITRATAVVAWLSLTYLRDQRYDDAAVKAALQSALLDPDSGLLGANVLGIGQAIYESQISAACLTVPGVTAIQDLQWRMTNLTIKLVEMFALIPIKVPIKVPAPRNTAQGCTGHRHDPGTGHYFSIPDDNQHLSLNGALAP